LAYLAGAVLTFVALAGLLLAARAAGQAAGWGFQLQSPLTVAILALVMLVVALNLSGVFEAGLSVQGAGQGLAARGGLLGAFVTGALAVVVAAPCTGPFMASAIGWAVLQPAFYALLVFAALGFGLALPFVAIAFLPGVSRHLPRPGVWMERLRQVLAFPMYGTAAWLVWVFVQETSPDALPFLFGAAIVLSFAAFLWGVAQRSGDRALISRALAVLALAASVPLCLAGVSAAAPGAAAPAGTAKVGDIAAEPWTPEAVARLRAAGRPVFVDFTAAWCVTCQVNEKTALATQEVADAFRRTNAAYLKADWTNRNPEIAKALSASGRSGVPLYLLYDAKGSEAPAILPQLLTSGAVVAALEGAAKPG
jgi:thiol:disulfide interchange protein DsbD